MDSETFCLAHATCVLRIWEWHDHTAAAVAGAVAAGPRMLQKMATSSCTGAESFEATISSSIAIAANEALALTAAANHLAERAGSFRHHLAHACIYMHVRPQARQLRARTPRTLALWKRKVGGAAGDTGSNGARATRERLVSTHGAPQEGRESARCSKERYIAILLHDLHVSLQELRSEVFSKRSQQSTGDHH